MINSLGLSYLLRIAGSQNTHGLRMLDKACVTLMRRGSWMCLTEPLAPRIGWGCRRADDVIVVWRSRLAGMRPAWGLFNLHKPNCQWGQCRQCSNLVPVEGSTVPYKRTGERCSFCSCQCKAQVLCRHERRV